MIYFLDTTVSNISMNLRVWRKVILRVASWYSEVVLEEAMA
ncbi:MAG: hypothetical protein ABSE90_05895 [Verrucomicrobiota bacterium]|jgi:hypothetical protein